MKLTEDQLVQAAAILGASVFQQKLADGSGHADAQAAVKIFREVYDKLKVQVL